MANEFTQIKLGNTVFTVKDKSAIRSVLPWIVTKQVGNETRTYKIDIYDDETGIGLDISRVTEEQ